PIGYYRAKDGYVVLIVTEGQWPSLCKAMGREDMIADPRFANNDARVANLEVLIETIEAWTMSFPGKDELVRVLTEAHVPVAPVLSVAEAVAHPHLIARETVRDIVDPVAGPMKIAGSPLNFRNYPKHTSGPAPLLGEHNADLLGRHLGYDAAKIRELEEAGVLHAEPAAADRAAG
ncbi:MAG: CoA transferase, partial [Alphaproteobacteria bacterium]|nr:CoA transferase [Alphaproteobacteria bacterium]